MRELWTSDRVNYRGEYYETNDASIYDRPEHPIPVYVAAGGPVVARYAGRAGDGFICTSGKGMSLYTDELIPAVKEGAEKIERSFDDIDRMIEIKLSYDVDPDLALENTRFWAPLALSKEQKHDITDPVEMEAAADALPIEQIASRWIVGSDPDEVVAGIKEYVDAGFNHLVFHAPGHDQRRFLDRIRAGPRAAPPRADVAPKRPRGRTWSSIHSDDDHVRPLGEDGLTQEARERHWRPLRREQH